MGIFVACDKNDTESTMLGVDRDRHGRIGSAGFVWSALKKECVQPFEIGIKLLPTDKSSTSVAYLLPNGDRSEV